MTGKKRIRVMVVDDHALIRRTLCDRLEGTKRFDVVARASNEQEAFALATETTPDVIVMDIDLGGRESLDVTRRIREALPDVRVVFVSALSHDRLIEFAVANPTCGYVTKREPFETMVSALEEAVAGRRYVSPDIAGRLIEAGGVSGPTEVHTRGSTLTDRQRQILVQIARGRSKKEIAASLHLSVKTIDTHTDHLMKRLAINDRVELTRFAIREGMLEA